MISIPYICEGEVIQVNETPSDSMGSLLKSVADIGGDKPKMKVRQIVSYTCLVTLATGEKIVCPSVIDSSLFGGIDDYFQIRRRASKDSVSSYSISTSSEKMNAQVGDRVYVAFIGGSVLRPVILSCAQHPNQTPRFEDGIDSSTKPQMFLKYLGASLIIDEDGQITFTHFGAPSIRYVGSDTGLDSLPTSPSAISSPSGYEGYEEGSESLEGPENKAVTPMDFKFKTKWEMLSSGMYRVRDSIGQNLVIDPEASQITITNNGIKSTDPADGGLGASLGGVLGSGEDAEVIRLDKVEQSIFINSRKLTTIYSGTDREDTTVGNYTKEVQGNEIITIQGDKTEDVYGGVVRTIYGEFTDDISQDISISCKASYTLDCVGDIAQSSKGNITIDAVGNISVTSKGDVSFYDVANAGIKVSGGKVEVGGSVTGIFATMSNTLEQLDKLIDAITKATVPTGTGPSGTVMNVADFINIKLKMAELKTKIDTVKGSL